MTIIYTYKNCSTCRKAIGWLREKNITFTERPIRETPPQEEELRQVLAACAGDLRGLFNTSGRDYRSLNLKERLPAMSSDGALQLLSRNGNLVKRPLLLTASSGCAGFRPDEWERLLL